MNIKEIEEMYPEGSSIRLIEMKGEEQMPKGLIGKVLFVDDAGQIHMKWQNGSYLALNLDCDRFEKVSEKEKISVLLIEPGKAPKMIEIDDSLEAMQAAVGGNIEEYMPFDDAVAIICNEEGKANGLALNRAIYCEERTEKAGGKGEILDIIAGSFLICYAPVDAENFKSLPKDLAKKYREIFKYPEKFSQTPTGIEVKICKHPRENLER